MGVSAPKRKISYPPSSLQTSSWPLYLLPVPCTPNRKKKKQSAKLWGWGYIKEVGGVGARNRRHLSNWRFKPEMVHLWGAQNGFVGRAWHLSRQTSPGVQRLQHIAFRSIFACVFWRLVSPPNVKESEEDIHHCYHSKCLKKIAFLGFQKRALFLGLKHQFGKWHLFHAYTDRGVVLPAVPGPKVFGALRKGPPFMAYKPKNLLSQKTQERKPCKAIFTLRNKNSLAWNFF